MSGAEKGPLIDPERAGFITQFIESTAKEHQNYASHLKKIVTNLLLCLVSTTIESHVLHSSISQCALRPVFHQKSLFSALFTCILHTSLLLCTMLSVSGFLFVFFPKNDL